MEHKQKQAISAHGWALCQLTLCFELQSTSKRKGIKSKDKLTLKGGSEVKSEPQKRFVKCYCGKGHLRCCTKTLTKPYINISCKTYLKSIHLYNPCVPFPPRWC